MASYEHFMAEAAVLYEDNKHLLPTYGHMIASALFPIVVGSYASLSRPSSAAKPEKKKGKDKKKDGSDTDEDEDEEEVVQKMEGLSPSDAIVFPLMAGTVLGGLYWLIKRYGADPVNLIFGWYFSFVGIFSMVKLIHNASATALSLLFPTYFAKDGKLWQVKDKTRTVVQAKTGKGWTIEDDATSPLPGWLRSVPIPARLSSVLWSIRSTRKQKYTVTAYMKRVIDATVNITALDVFALLVGIGANSYTHFVDKPWWLTNLQGFAVSYQTLQFLSPTTFLTGSFILVGLFCYDIWAVFFTPLMVTVAKNLDQPIKLLIPRPDEPGRDGKPPTKAYSMLGLGDIVLPGMIIGLALRFDLFLFYLRKQKKTTRKNEVGEEVEDVIKPTYTTATGQWGSRLWTIGLPSHRLPIAVASAAFPKPYFTTSIVGYVVGMVATLLVMTIWQHAQPALLYLVPGVLISVWSTALVRGELKEFRNYSEALTGEALDETDEKKDEEAEEEQGDESEAGKDSKGWWASLVGLFKKDEKEDAEEDNKSSKKERKSKKQLESEEEEKTPSKLKLRAIEEPDHIISFSIKCHNPTARSSIQATAETDSVQKSGSKSTRKSVNAASDSGSDDLILVSKDDEELAGEGPSARTRSRRGRASGVRRV